MKSGFIQEGEKVFLVGSNSLRPRLSDLAGSEYLHLIHNKVVGRPTIDIGLEKALQSFCRKAISDRLLSSCHDCSDGGLAIAISESAMQNQIGFIANSTLSAPSTRWDTILFGERQSRVIISISPENEKELLATANTLGVPLSEIGTTGGGLYYLREQFIGVPTRTYRFLVQRTGATLVFYTTCQLKRRDSFCDWARNYP
ncbi:MAG: hypothetical protein CM1200mP15_05700 [Dehalococcoidia bacterium]|nr:MAG: hypothetical protein CM1200mP15_05700 [Dehalococcoidia bacterium]